MLKSIQPTLSDVKTFKRFKGRYFMVACLQKHGKNGEPYWEIGLSDSTTTVKVYCFDQRHFFSSFQANSLVHVEVCVKTHLGKLYLRCVYLENVSQEKLINNLDIESLPSALCPFPSLLEGVVELFQSIDNLHLKRFVSQTLLQSDVATKYINRPTRVGLKQSINNCLLSKTLLVAKKLLKNVDLDTEQRDLAIAFSMVHEVGKVNKYTSESTFSAIGARLDIEDITLSICSSPLKELATKSTALQYQMRYLLTIGFTSKRGSFNVNSFYSCLNHFSESRFDKQSKTAAFNTICVPQTIELMSQ
jgi:hypothetical protein